MLPEQSLHIAQTMLEPILTLKSLVSAVKSDKECMNVGSVRVKDPFNHLLKFYKLNNGAVAKGTSIERCFEFKGDANAVRIRTLQPADLPPPASNVISILDARTGNCLGTINRESPRFNQCVNSTNLKVAAKISSGGESKDMEYSGCKLVLRPKVSSVPINRRVVQICAELAQGPDAPARLDRLLPVQIRGRTLQRQNSRSHSFPGRSHGHPRRLQTVFWRHGG